MGWAGNPEPTYDIPTVIADHVESVKKKRKIIFCL
jgi:hypothetical protein